MFEYRQEKKNPLFPLRQARAGRAAHNGAGLELLHNKVALGFLDDAVGPLHEPLAGGAAHWLLSPVTQLDRRD